MDDMLAAAVAAVAESASRAPRAVTAGVTVVGVTGSIATVRGDGDAFGVTYTVPCINKLPTVGKRVVVQFLPAGGVMLIGQVDGFA